MQHGWAHDALLTGSVPAPCCEITVAMPPPPFPLQARQCQISFRCACCTSRHLRGSGWPRRGGR